MNYFHANYESKGLQSLTDQEVLKCLRYIRLAPGKVYAFELLQVLNREEKDLDSILEEVCFWREKEFVLIDKSDSVSDILRLTALYTNPQYRFELDSLLEISNETMHSVAIANVEYLHDHKVTAEYVLKDRSALWQQTYRQVTMDDLISLVKAQQPLDLSPGRDRLAAYIENFNYEKLVAAAEPGYNPLQGFNAKSALFVGTVSFNNAYFEDQVYFENAVFSCESLSFKQAQFKNNSSFRNVRLFCPIIDFSDLSHQFIMIRIFLYGKSGLLRSIEEKDCLHC